MMTMLFDYLREFSFISVLLRLLLAMLFGGVIGLERGRKRRAAGFRTYMLVCLGAALTMLLSQYLHRMLNTIWAGEALTIDVSRISAQVINGIGFLGAGTIIVTGRQQVKGLTTAAGLWASACMGIAIGAGYIECVLFAFLLILLVVRLLPAVENYIVDHSKYMNIYVEFDALDNLGSIINGIKALDIQIYEVEIERGEDGRSNGAVFVLRLNRRQHHTLLLLALSELECVTMIEEI